METKEEREDSDILREEDIHRMEDILHNSLSIPEEDLLHNMDNTHLNNQVLFRVLYRLL